MSESKIYTIPDGNSSLDPNLMLALSQNGGFGNGGNWMWMMFMWILFPWLFNGNGFGNNGGGFLANLLNNDAGRDLLLQAINGRADALSQLSTMLNTSVGNVLNAVNTVQQSVLTVGAQLGLTGQLIINSVQAGNAAISQLLCQCCCENRLAIANQTNALLSQAAANHSAATLLSSQNHAEDMLQRALAEAADLLAVCLQTNTLLNQAERDTNAILNAISGQNTLITKEFCDLKERELQNKINTQGDIITQLRNQISNDHLTLQFNAAFHALDDKIDAIAAKLPQTVPVLWPNLTAVNTTPYAGNYWGNGFGNGIVF